MPLSLDVLRSTIGADVAAAREAIGHWLHEDAELDVRALADLCVPAVEAMLARGWIRVPDGEERAHLEHMLELAYDVADPRSRGAVAGLVELVYWVLRGETPPPSPRPRLAAQMYRLGPTR